MLVMQLVLILQNQSAIMEALNDGREPSLTVQIARTREFLESCMSHTR
jgi:hypothetical protein